MLLEVLDFFLFLNHGFLWIYSDFFFFSQGRGYLLLAKTKNLFVSRKD